jgi:hypothetical protein
MKTHLDELENQKRQFEVAIEKAGQRFKWCLLGVGIGVILIPLYGVGIPVLLGSGAGVIYYTIKRSRSQDRLGDLETEIHKLEISMA